MDEQRDADEAFHRSRNGLPTGEELRAMSYVQLCSLLENSASGSTRYFIVEAEKKQRDALLLAKEVDVKIGKKPTPDHWYKKPVPVICTTVIASAVTLIVRQVLIHYGLLS